MADTPRFTLADVAAKAGVSKMTASRALRGAADVSPTSGEKVRQAARALGYVGNHLAASLSGRRADLIGVVVPSVANIVFAEVLEGIAEGIDKSGLQAVFGVTDYDPDREYDVIRNMLSWNPAGMIVTGLDQPPETRRLLAHAGIPVVQIMDSDGDPIDACVGLSHHQAGAQMAQALLAAGRRRFGYIGCGLERDTRARKRLDGFSATLSAQGLAWVAIEGVPGPSTIGAGQSLTAHLLRDWPDVDCLYFSSDDVAAGGAFHCMAAGIEVPGRLMLAGFNGLDIVRKLPLAVATSVTLRRDIGRAAARVLLADRANPQSQAPRLIEFIPSVVF